MDAVLRRKLLAAIHVEKKKAGLTDADYRAVLRAVVGVESAGDCSPQELKRLADHFKGFSRPMPLKNKDDNYYHIVKGIEDWKQKRHVAAMWVELGYKASGLDTRAKKQFGREDFTRLTTEDLQTLGRDLAKRLSKRKGKAA